MWEVVDGDYAGLMRHSQTYTFKTSSECSAKHAEVSRSPNQERSWWGRWEPKDITACEPCGGGNSSDAHESNRNRDLEDLFVQKLVGNDMALKFFGYMHPVSKENLLTLISMFPENPYLQAGLRTLGTSLGAVNVANAYVKIFQEASETSLRQALAVLNIPYEQRADFMRATGGYLLTHDRPTSIYPTIGQTSAGSPAVQYLAGYSDLEVANNALIIAATLTEYGVSEENAYIAAGLLGLSSLIAAERDDRQLASLLAQSALTIVEKSNHAQRFTDWTDLIAQSAQIYQIEVPNLKTTQAQLGQPVVSNFSGTYQSADESPLPPGISRSSTPLTLSATGNTISFQETVTVTDAPQTQYGMTKSSGKSTHATTYTCTLAGVNRLECRYTTESESLPVTVTILGKSSTIPASRSSISGSCTVEITPSGQLQFSYDNGNVAIYQKL